jgi:hypothetical protein
VPVALAVAAALLVALPPSLGAQTLHIEAENYVAAQHIDPDDFYVVDGVLYGFDFAGEWTRYDLPALAPGRYAVVLKLWGSLGTPYSLHLIVDNPPNTPQTVDLDFIGRGSCGT